MHYSASFFLGTFNNCLLVEKGIKRKKSREIMDSHRLDDGLYEQVGFLLAWL